MRSRTVLATLLLLGTCGPILAQSAPSGAAPFTSMQHDLFNVPGSLSNAWADFDRDGDLDLAVSLKGGEIRLYRNDKGIMTSVGASMGLPTGGGEYRGMDWGDYDSDGWIDLYAGSSLPDKRSMLFHNDRGMGFTEVAITVGLDIPGRSSRQNNWIDYDNDGDVDLYATDRMGFNKLFRNNGGKFTQVFVDGGPTVKKSTVGACWLDFDKDGDLDVFLANQSGQTDSLFRNDGTAFVDVAPSLGMENSGRDKTEGGVGCAVGDYDNDGNLDIFVPNYGKNTLWHNTGDGTFTNMAVASGVGVDNHAVGAAWGDYDNDGLLDLYVTSYHGEAGKQEPADALFHNDGNGRFTNVIDANPLLNTADHGVTWVDYDGNGGIDLSVTRGYSPIGGHYLMRNGLASEAAKRSLAVLVLDAKGRYLAPGAEVRVYDKAGKLLGTQPVSTGGGYGAQNASAVHFGLPSMDPVTVEVTFMSAKGRVVQKIPNVRIARYAGAALVVKRRGR